MERDMNAQNSTACRGGCGFFGSQATNGLCSQCFKDSLKRKQDTARLSPTSLSSTSNNSNASLLGDASTSTNDDKMTPMTAAHIDDQVNSMSKQSPDYHHHQQHQQQQQQEDSSPISEPGDSPSSYPSEVDTKSNRPKRCQICKKRVGLTGFACRCGGVYCGCHRYTDQHECSFDYKTMEREELRKNNPVVVSDKIQRL